MMVKWKSVTKARESVEKRALLSAFQPTLFHAFWQKRKAPSYFWRCCDLSLDEFCAQGGGCDERATVDPP